MNERQKVTGSALAAGLVFAGADLADPETVGLTLAAYAIVIAAAERIIEEQDTDRIAATIRAPEAWSAAWQHERP